MTEHPALDPARLERADRALRAFVESGQRAGLVWAVARDGEILASGAHGVTDKRSGRPMAEDSIFRVYSMVRAVTAVAVLQLVEQGRVDLGAPVSTYLPQFSHLQAIDSVTGESYTTRPATRPVTVTDLLTFTSGIAYAPQYPSSARVDHRAILNVDQSVDEAMETIAANPLREQPGERWRYGYHSDVLGALVETVSGQRMDRYYREHIFDPLGMPDTGFMVPPADQARFVRAYDASGEDITDRLPPSSVYTRETTFHSGGGGLVSTARDWVRFAGMLANDGEVDGVRILEAATVRAMRENHLDESQGPLFWYTAADAGGKDLSSRFAGYGWGYSIGVRLPGSGHNIPGPEGEIVWGGFANTHWFADPESGLVALVFAQYLGDDAELIDMALRNALFSPEN